MKMGQHGNNHGKEPTMDTVKKAPAARSGMHHDAGGEKYGDVKAVQDGGSRAEGAKGPGSTKLSGATAELRKQHPHHHSAGGIHGTKDHVRHETGKY